MDELCLESRKKIYNLIKKSPGIHFREIEKRLNMAVGSLQYHLHYLEKRNIIRSEHYGDYVRYFPKDCQLDDTDKKILSFLRRKTSRHILLYLLEKPANHKEISENIGLSPSTISWHLNKLVEAGIVEKTKKGRTSLFKVNNSERIINLLIIYKESFFDKLVDGFVEIWENAEL
ncbi:winged helix-turn-helix transcriptional regulator [Methanothermococcus sp. Ax23]|uniref:winged helix-turn-helix transcriptional regulator n=1 Tax=Methanothermococcus sp. Ax23 TaxID=3156486 RepID=UPI003B9FB250